MPCARLCDCNFTPPRRLCCFPLLLSHPRPTGQRAEVRVPVTTLSAGTARVQCAAELVGSPYVDAAEVAVPVYSPATFETFATYGEMDNEGLLLQPVQAPGEVWASVGHVELMASSTVLHKATDAFIYLVSEAS